MPTTTHRLNVDQGRAATGHRKFSSHSCRSVPCCRVRAVDGPCWKAHSGCLVSPHLDTRLLRRRCIKGDLVVLENVGDRKTAGAGEVHGFPKLSGGRCTLANAGDVEAAEGLTPCGEGQAGHGCGGDRQRCGRREHPDVPRTNVQISSTGVVPSAVLIRTDLPKVGRHHIERCVTHGQAEANITNHGGDKVAVVALAGACVSRGVGLAFKRRGNGNHALLPGRTEAFPAKSAAVRRFYTVGEDFFQSPVKASGAGHHALPFHAVRHGDGHVVSEPAHHQPHVDKEVRSAPLKHHGHASAWNHLVLEILTEGAFHLLLETTFKRVDESLGEGMP